MNDTRRIPTPIVVVAAVVSLGLVAYGARSGNRIETSRSPVPLASSGPVDASHAADLDTYRAELSQVMTALQETAALIDSPELSARALFGVNLAESISDADLEALAATGVDFAPLTQRVTEFRDQLLAERASGDLQLQGGDSCTSDPSFPQPDFQGGPQSRALTGVTFAAYTVLQIGETVWTGAHMGCRQDAVINVSVACIVADIIRLALNETYDFINFKAGFVDGKQIKTTLDRLGVLHTQVADLTAGAAVLLSKIDATLVKANELAEENERLRQTNCELLRLLLLPLDERKSNEPNCPQLTSPLAW